MTATTSRTTPAPGRQRIAASAWDYLVIIGWIAVLTVAGTVIRVLIPAGVLPPLDTLPAIDLVAFVTTVLPVGIYLTVTEARTRQASWGKRRAGLSAVVWTAYALSLALPVASIAMAWRDPLARALHDRIAGTHVVLA